MAKINIDIEEIKESLNRIGYIVNDVIERENNGKNWQLKFSNSGAVATVYDTNTKKNTVVNGKLDENEGVNLKNIIDGIKCKEIIIDSLNEKIVELINMKKEDYFFDYKVKWHDNNADLLHDILCLSNNIENAEAYLIIGVSDDHEVVGIDEEKKSNEIYDFLREKKFAGDHMPEIEMKKLFYQYKKIEVLVCKSSKYVPFYLTENHQGVCDHQIYTRVGDTNTPKNRHANFCDTERLWKIHFERENE